MTKSKHKSNKAVKRGLIRGVHIQAIFFLVVYTIISKAVFIKSITSSNMFIVFLVPYFFGITAGIIFLYLFNHEDFFHFMKEVEKEDGKKEKKYLKRFKHYGKIISTLIIAAIGGPIFSALTIRFLLNNVWYRYILIAVGNIASTLFAIFFTGGLLRLFWL